jgi:uncharacterized protein YqgC (DUF456 family)
MNTLLVVLGFICIIVGIAGSILPVLPGIPLSYVGILLLHFSKNIQFSTQFLVILGIVIVVIRVLNYYIPAWGTKKYGGSKLGVWGSIIGMTIGIFFGIWGIIFGPFLGAVLGEMIHGKDTSSVLKAGWGTFVGFLWGVIINVMAGGFMLYYAIKAVV